MLICELIDMSVDTLEEQHDALNHLCQLEVVSVSSPLRDAFCPLFAHPQLFRLLTFHLP